MERAEPDAFGALADGFYNAVLHFTSGFVGKREAKDIFTREIRVRFEQVADAFGDYASLAGAGAGNDKKGAFAVFDGSALLDVQLEGGFLSGFSGHGGSGTPRVGGANRCREPRHGAPGLVAIRMERLRWF